MEAAHDHRRLLFPLAGGPCPARDRCGGGPRVPARPRRSSGARDPGARDVVRRRRRRRRRGLAQQPIGRRMAERAGARRRPHHHGPRHGRARRLGHRRRAAPAAEHVGPGLPAVPRRRDPAGAGPSTRTTSAARTAARSRSTSRSSSASLAFLGYMLLRPMHADAVTSMSTLVFATIAATMFTTYAALALWVPTPRTRAAVHRLRRLLLRHREPGLAVGARLVHGRGGHGRAAARARHAGAGRARHLLPASDPHGARDDADALGPAAC